MIVVSAIEVSGREAAIRAMRNPLKSWTKSDTSFDQTEAYIGVNDLKLAMKLALQIPPSDYRHFRRNRAGILVEAVRHLQGGNGSLFYVHNAHASFP